ncbi:MAG: glutamine amidotransferase [Clostridia bacterium]|nr:glutamine amidotransferase [Clostridia bacterium]
MELHICHLYPDLLNLYGDIGNVKILQYRAEKRGITVHVHSHSVGDQFNKDMYDIVMFGGGQDFEMSIVSKDLSGKNKEKMAQYIEDGGVLLAICGGYQMLGDYYMTAEGEKIDGLGILQFYTNGGTKRLIGNAVIDINGDMVVGFENHAGRTYIGQYQPLGKVVSGYGNNGEDGGEGLKYKETYCTYLHGPVLSKNPALADHLILTALKKRYPEATLAPIDDSMEISANQSMLNRLQI